MHEDPLKNDHNGQEQIPPRAEREAAPVSKMNPEAFALAARESANIISVEATKRGDAGIDDVRGYEGAETSDIEAATAVTASSEAEIRSAEMIFAEKLTVLEPEEIIKATKTDEANIEWDPNGDTPPSVSVEIAGTEAGWNPDGDVPPPLPVERESSLDTEKTYDAGKAFIERLRKEGRTDSTEYRAMSFKMMRADSDAPIWKERSEVDIPIVTKILEKYGGKSVDSLVGAVPPPLPKEDVVRSYTNESRMRDRTLREPELLGPRDASKEFLSEERKRLADEIREARKKQREEILSLISDIKAAETSSEEMEAKDAECGSLSQRMSDQSSEMALRITSDPGSDEQGVRDEEGNFAALLGSGDALSVMKEKLARHYAEAGDFSREKFEFMKKTVEQTMLRNDAFVVHAFLDDEKLRHNANSNISSRATLRDDLDLLMSLEPSVSASSVVPGCEHGLWGGGKRGVLLGGGDIMGAAQTDNATSVGGIKYRNGSESSSTEIDEKVSDRSPRGYNELVVNNSKVYGLFQGVTTGESGEMSGFKFETRPGRQSVNAERKKEFLEVMDMAVERGVPPLVMTPDRRVFEFVSIGDDGVVTVGEEITPERVATGKAGLSNEARQKIGNEVISKNLFKHVSHQVEAHVIMTDLESGVGERPSEEYLTRINEIKTGAVELSREEYVAFARDNKGSVGEFPKALLADKAFMEEVALYNPTVTYRYASESLRSDVEFIKYLYSLGEGKIQLYSGMPEDLKKDESVMMLAVENDDFASLDISASDSPEIWNRIVEKEIRKDYSASLSAVHPGKKTALRPYLLLNDPARGSVDFSERLLSDERFISGLKGNNPGFDFEMDGSTLIATRSDQGGDVPDASFQGERDPSGGVSPSFPEE